MRGGRRRRPRARGPRRSRSSGRSSGSSRRPRPCGRYWMQPDAVDDARPASPRRRCSGSPGLLREVARRCGRTGRGSSGGRTGCSRVRVSRPGPRRRARASPGRVAPGRPRAESGPGTGQTHPSICDRAAGPQGRCENEGRPVAVAASRRPGGTAPRPCREAGEGSPEESTCGAVPASREAGARQDRGACSGSGGEGGEGGEGGVVRTPGFGPICGREVEDRALDGVVADAQEQGVEHAAPDQVAAAAAADGVEEPAAVEGVVAGEAEEDVAAVGTRSGSRCRRGRRPGGPGVVALFGIHGLGQGEPAPTKSAPTMASLPVPPSSESLPALPRTVSLPPPARTRFDPAARRCTDCRAGPPGSGRHRRRRRCCRCPGRR